MVSGKDVWHTSFGHGKLVGSDKDCVRIQFLNGLGATTILNSAWGVHLFDDENEYSQACDGNKLDPDKMRRKYAHYKKLDRRRYYSAEKATILPSFAGKTKRNIVVLENRAFRRSRAVMRQVVGIDAFTGKIVNIVDTNGKEEGLLSNSREWEDLPENAVIQAEFMSCPGKLENTLRVVSKLRLLGTSDIRRLHDKYMDGRADADFVQSFDILDLFCEYHYNAVGFTVLNFTGTKVEFYKNKYQIKIGRSFVDIASPEFVYNPEFPYYSGITLIKYRAEPSGTIIMQARKLYGSMDSVNQYNEKQRIKKEKEAKEESAEKERIKKIEEEYQRFPF